ncbi:MAG: hypothetical protein HDS71_07660 [Bacteroidales bacterium]|nr:hypothetical protein [Bacteroidales bacterium]MBD5223902.1 hypothetical protein [Bacteroidales bacterium]
MKSKVSYSRFVIILTAAISIMLFAGCIATVHDQHAFFILLTIYLALFISSLFYAPFYIKADSRYITLGSIFKSRKLRLYGVESVELFQPTMGAIKIFASGGFMGYWGLFREGDIGSYYAFYGRSSECFLVRMKNGNKYVLGCNNPGEMVEYINSQLELLNQPK